MQILGQYLSAISGISENDKEHTHRSALEAFLNAILDALTPTHKDFSAISIIHEPNNDKSEVKAGAPDFQIILNGGGAESKSLAHSGLTLGYIENKRVNADLAELISESNDNPRAQIAKYLSLSDNLILTDYLRFLRIGKNASGKIVILQEVQICALSELPHLANATQSAHKSQKHKSTLAILESREKELLDFFALFFSATPKPIITALEFANALAQRTKLVKDSLIQNADNHKIYALYNTFAEMLYKELDFESFCDSFAQTLTYALFLARLNDAQNETLTLRNAPDYIPRSFPLIRAMSEFLKELNDLESIAWLIKEILSIINHIDPAQITLELNKIAEKDLLGNYLHKDPYLHFYETFLSQYDPRLRELRGVYYTPFAVVSFIINAIDSTLKRDFGESKGLGSALENDTITLLDFATGTGTFLLEAFRKALESTPPNSLHYKPKNLLSRFSGFEFLIAPYTIAHLKISQSFKEEFNAPLEDSEKLNILLTNTIYAKSAKDEQNTKSNLFAGMYELANEFLEAQTLKEKRILIITGNPPYSGASANKGLYEDEVKIAYGLEPKLANLNNEAQRIIKSYFANPSNQSHQKAFKSIFEPRRLQNEKNPKWLLDDYVKFIRFAESKIEAQESGIIAIISNNSFLDNPTFRGMRYHLLKSFDKIYILDLHGNTRKKEKSPSGDKDDNVFDIMQGVCISVFVKTGAKNLPCHTEGKARSISNTPESRDISAFSKPQYDKDLDSSLHATRSAQNDKMDCHESLRDSRNDSNTDEHSKILSEKSGLCSHERGNKTDLSIDEASGKLPDLSPKAECSLAQIYHYDLFGKRKDKYAFLQSNGLDSIEWSELTPKAPFYLFIPQNESLRSEYDKGISVKDMFKVSSVGIVSGRDSFCISKTISQESLQELKDNIARFMNLDSESARKEFNLGADSRDWKVQYAQKELKETNNNPNNYIKIQYRPFDSRWTYYTGKSKGFHCMPRGEVMRHFLSSLRVSEANAAIHKKAIDCHDSANAESRNDNIGLNTPRQLKTSQGEWNHALIQNSISDQALTSGGNGAGVVHPLYLKTDSSLRGSGKATTKQSTISCHSEGAKRPKNPKEAQNRDISLNAQYDKDLDSSLRATHSAQNDGFGVDCHESANANSRNDTLSCHTEGEARSISNKNKEIFRYAQNDKNLDSSVASLPQNDKEKNDKENVEWVENFTPEFRNFIDAKYGERFTPEVILGYIYAILYHKDYREKYVDFLKIDFPKIPFVESKEKFLALSALGCELIDLHLMRKPRHERERERERVMRINIGLNVARQSKVWGAWQYAFVTSELVDLSLMGGGNTGAGHIFPLYLRK